MKTDNSRLIMIIIIIIIYLNGESSKYAIFWRYFIRPKVKILDKFQAIFDFLYAFIPFTQIDTEEQKGPSSTF